jgi:NAD(P)-dependent dehydrogenase (short-subunit alcohol dehydrogenase family)
MEAMASKVYETLGKVDILINNAGIVNPLVLGKDKAGRLRQGHRRQPQGTFYATQAFGKRMIQQGSGRIVSIASQVALFGEKGFLPYAIANRGSC